MLVCTSMTYFYYSLFTIHYLLLTSSYPLLLRHLSTDHDQAHHTFGGVGDHVL
jgi:hypothetical protein